MRKSHGTQAPHHSKVQILLRLPSVLSFLPGFIPFLVSLLRGYQAKNRREVSAGVSTQDAFPRAAASQTGRAKENCPFPSCPDARSLQPRLLARRGPARPFPTNSDRSPGPAGRLPTDSATARGPYALRNGKRPARRRLVGGRIRARDPGPACRPPPTPTPTAPLRVSLTPAGRGAGVCAQPWAWPCA